MCDAGCGYGGEVNKKIKKLWVKALRSGKYKQTTGVLNKKVSGKNRYCCLGVLRVFVTHNNSGNTDEEEELLSVDFLKNCGLTAEQQTSCAIMNDTERKTFSEIADVIEQEF